MSYNLSTTAYEHNPASQIAAIRNAYAAAELPAPAASNEARDLLEAELAPRAVANDVAASLFGAPTAGAAKAVATGIARVARAQAAALIRQQMGETGPELARAAMPALIEQAVADLSPAFAEVASELVTVATKLDPEHPLDHEVAYKAETSREVKRAEVLLTKLSTFGAVHNSRPVPRMVSGIAPLLPVVALPSCVVEAYIPTHGPQGRWPTVNGADLDATRAVRALAEDCRLLGADYALVKVSQGVYPGATLSLATVADLRERQANATRAEAQRRATDEEVRAYNQGK